MDYFYRDADTPMRIWRDHLFRLLRRALLSCAIFVLAALCFSKNRDQPVAPLWRFDLRSLGYRAPEVEADRNVHKHLDDAITFLNDQILGLAFVTREDVTTLVKRSRSGRPGPLRLHGVVLDTKSSQVRTTHEWSTMRYAPAFFATSEGKILVSTGDALTLYSANFEKLTEYIVSLCKESTNAGWRPSVTPSARYVFVKSFCNISGKTGVPERIEVLNANTLEPVHSWCEDTFFSIESVSDKAIVTRRNDKDGLLWFYIRNLGQRWHPIYHPTDKNGCWGSPHFTDDSILVCADLKVLRIDGTLLAGKKLRKNEVTNAVRPSRDGRRFAVSIDTYKGGSDFLDISGHVGLSRVVVYDVPTLRELFSLEIKPLPKDYLQYALSPDGFLLGVVVDGVVALYKLPESPPSAPGS